MRNSLLHAISSSSLAVKDSLLEERITFITPYVTGAVTFDGTNDLMLRGGDLTNNADSNVGSLSLWLKMNGGTGSSLGIMHASGGYFVSRPSTNKFRIVVANSTSNLQFETVTNVTSSTGWVHVLASWNTNFSAGNKLRQLYLNDVSNVTTVADAAAAFNVDYTQTNHAVGSMVNTTQKLNADLADVWFAPGQYIDFSVQANRRKFRNGFGKPVYLGTNGELPTGTAPRIFLQGPASAFAMNKGTGGNFTVTGTLTDALTSPSD